MAEVADPVIPAAQPRPEPAPPQAVAASAPHPGMPAVEAGRIFGLLPEDQSDEMRSLRDEFEAGETPEARFAKATDRLQQQLLNYQTNGRTWIEHGITMDMPLSLGPRVIANASDTLAQYAGDLIPRAGENGFFHEPDHSRC